MSDEENSSAGEGTEQLSKEALESAQEEALSSVQHSNNIPGIDDDRLSVVMEIPVTLGVEIGRSRVTIKQLLQLTQGSVVELDRLAGEPMDVLVNGTLIAHGEVVVVNDRFGIRLTDVISAAERLKKLN
ncbi:MAG TPA: flagellar motor switch protein FliN [Gammaproteobacteria bacterium]|nr:flagellar motor switch protein FliN [Gammaproteobacteria bacterium]